MSGSEAWNLLPSIFSLPASEGGTTENTEYTEWKAGFGSQPSVCSVYSVVVVRRVGIHVGPRVRGAAGTPRKRLEGAFGARFRLRCKRKQSLNNKVKGMNNAKS